MVSVEADPAFPLILDLGTGLSRFAAERAHPPNTYRATALVTHLHFDHVQGLPFFAPADEPGSAIDIYAPAQGDVTLHEAFGNLIRPPYFPIRLDEFGATLRFHEVGSDTFSVGRATVMARPVPHNGPTVGYRVECDGVTIAYVSDHQAPPDQATVPDPVLELCDGVDLLIHDAQYTQAEFARKPRWGHSTVDYAVLVARRAGARRLFLFHHDPSHGDDELDAIASYARGCAHGDLEEVVAAYEGLTVDVLA